MVSNFSKFTHFKYYKYIINQLNDILRGRGNLWPTEFLPSLGVIFRPMLLKVLTLFQRFGNTCKYKKIGHSISFNLSQICLLRLFCVGFFVFAVERHSKHFCGNDVAFE